ncbi:MAG: hypothetical protein KDB80_01440, partial [Planctomycetes bacterium]|nr:hypothetical protein [Planctomycetota bacterium]
MRSSTAPAPRSVIGASVALLLGLIAGCAPDPTPAEPMAIVRIAPALDADDPPRVFLNQEITVYFSQPVEKTSVNRDAFRVVDANGNHVDGTLRVGLRSVTFEPVPPVAATLDDGSFRPSGRYTLEIAGMPLWNTLRSVSGERLARGFSCPFDIVPVEGAADHATPFLPHGAVTEPFGLMERTEPRLAADVGTVDLHFNLAVLPPSATIDALQVYEVSSGQRRRVWPQTVRVLGERRPHAEHYGSTVRLSFGPGQLDPWPSLYYMFLRGSEGQSLRDYLGRPLVDGDRVLELDVVPGDRPRVMVLGGSEPWHLSREVAAPLGFAQRGTRVEVQCGVEAGDGRHGWLRPRSSLTIEPGQRFDRGDGVLVEASADLQFLGIDIGPGVTVRVVSREPIRIRSVGSVSIRGRLLLETPMGDAGWLGGERFGQGEIVDLDRLLEASGCAFVVGGHFHNAGSVEHVHEGERGSPLTLVVVGQLESTGRAPAEVIVGMDDRN